MAQSGQKIPGYSGHIPLKQDLIGLTTGESNRKAGQDYVNSKTGMSSAGAQIVSSSQLGSMRSTQVDGSSEGLQKTKMIGNNSRESATWLNGPKHNIRNQCVPGYTGFISGVKSENLFAKSYADNTAKSFKEKITRGADLAPEKRFVSMSQKKYNDKHFRRVQQSPDNTSKRDYLEYMMTINQEHAAKPNQTSTSFLQRAGSTDRFTGAYMDQTGATMSPQKYSRHLNGSPMLTYSSKTQIKPAMLEKNLTGNQNYEKLPENFKRIFTEDMKDQQMKIPIVGYAGHRKGEKAENMYAKNYRDTAI